MNKVIFILTSLLTIGCAFAQPKTHSIHSASSIKSSLPILMPYNRLIRSAGTVLTYGNPELENHALDITLLPGKKSVAVEDRYGIAMIDVKTNSITARWIFSDSAAYKDLLSTYSGLASFVYKDTSYLAWGAQGSGASRGFIVIARVSKNQISTVSFIRCKAIAPAKVAIPNAVAINFENNIPYLYVVLNGNNELVKINAINHQTRWTATTGEAPFGICIVKSKAYITNWAGEVATDTAEEHAGTPWGSVYTNPVTGATKQGSVSIIDIASGQRTNRLMVGLHPNAIIKSSDDCFVYVANGNSDNISVIDVKKERVIDSIGVSLFSNQNKYYGSSPNGLCTSADGTRLYVCNGLDNAVAVVRLGKAAGNKSAAKTKVQGYIPTEAYPSGIMCFKNKLYVANLEAKGAGILTEAHELKEADGKAVAAFSIHKQMASVSIIPLPGKAQLNAGTEKVKGLNSSYRLVASLSEQPRHNVLPKPVPERIGEPSLFKHVVYIIKENKTYDQVYGDVKEGNGDSNLCVYGASVTPNQHLLLQTFPLLDHYFASGKSSAEGHQWTDAAMVSDYVEKNVRAWFRSYPHRQEDALVYNKAGFIWNDAMDHGKTVRIYGEACTTLYDTKMNWFDIYNKYASHDSLLLHNVTTIARIRPVIHPHFPDCDNFIFTDQIRADDFINEWRQYENKAGDSLPDLLIVSLPNDHTAGTSPDFPTPRAMVADNDLALGRMIETVTGSRFWDSTVVFVTEDDSQSGWDHVSPYRTTGMVISPYSVLQKTIRTNYNQTSMVRTIEQILGLPPMNIIDATATPMFDCFTNTKNTKGFQFIVNQIPLNEKNKPLSALKGRALYYAKLSKASAFKELDSGDDDDMNRILWFAAKGNKAYPGAK